MSDYINFKGRQKFIAGRPVCRTPEQLAADSAFETAGNHAQVPLTPIHIDWEVSTMCNLSCKMCYRRSLEIEPKLADLELYEKTMKELKQLNALPLSMKFNYRGEPLANPDLPEFIRIAKDCGVVDVRINTNGLLLTPDYIDDLRDVGLDYIIVSVDADTPETYVKVRSNEEDFDHLINNIHRMISVYDDEPPWIHLNYVIQDANKHEVNDFVEYWRDKVHGIRLIKVRDNKTKGTPHFCRQPFQRLVVTLDGDIRMCCGDWAGDYIIGHLDKDHPGLSIIEAWNSKKLADVRREMYNMASSVSHGNWDKLPEVCQKCEVNKWD